MLLLDEKTDARSADAGTETACMGLKMRGEDGSEFAYDLPIGKSTLGSGARCGIRIQQPGVQPIHCLFQRTTAELSVKRWADPCQLNGLPFDHATVSIGDRLTIGSIEFEIIGDAEPVEPEVAIDELPPEHDDELEIAIVEPASSDPPATPERALFDVETQDEPRNVAESPLPNFENDPTSPALAHASEEWTGEAQDDSTADEPLEPIFDDREQLLQDCEQLRAESARLSEQEQSLTEANRNLSQQCDELTNEVAALTEKLAPFADTNTDLAEENASLLHERDQLREEHTQVWDKIARLKVENETFGNDVSRLAEDNAELLAENARLRQEADELRGEFEQLRALETTISSEHCELTAQLQAANAELLESLADVKRQLEESQQQLATAQAASQEHEGIASDLRQELQIAERREIELTEKLAEIESQLSELQSQPAEAEAPVARSTPGEPITDSPWDVADAAEEAEEEEAATGSGWGDIAKEETAEPNREERADVWEFRSAFRNDSDDRGAIEPEELIESKEQAEPTDDSDRSHALFSPAPIEAGHSFAAATSAIQPAPTSSPQTSANVSDEEESIEDYMAKLMQRLRGDSTPMSASQAPPPASPKPTAARQEEPQQRGPLPPDAAAAEPGESQSVQPANITASEYKPTGPAPERKADMQALRELANASARSAIAVHSTQVHRRSAKTKVIVSTLAAMTSLWLMLQAPDWRGPEFISACVLLLVAAYWSGQTFQTFLESIRAGNYEGSDYDWEADDSEKDGPLPIDIDEERW